MQDDDRELLNDYELWKGREQPDAIGAFLQEREDKANTRRLGEALDLLNTHIFNFEQLVTQGTEDSTLENNMLTAMEGVRSALQADRPYDDVTTFDGATERVYL